MFCFLLVYGGVVNLLASEKAPREVSIFMAGGSLTALNKLKDGCPSDVRPIAVGEGVKASDKEMLMCSCEAKGI